MRSFCENLKYVSIGFFHCSENTLDKLKRYLLMKKIAHGVYKNKFRFPPLERQIDKIVMQCKFEFVRVAPIPHSFETMCKPLRITI